VREADVVVCYNKCKKGVERLQRQNVLFRDYRRLLLHAETPPHHQEYVKASINERCNTPRSSTQEDHFEVKTVRGAALGCQRNALFNHLFPGQRQALYWPAQPPWMTAGSPHGSNICPANLLRGLQILFLGKLGGRRQPFLRVFKAEIAIREHWLAMFPAGYCVIWSDSERIFLSSPVGSPMWRGPQTPAPAYNKKPIPGEFRIWESWRWKACIRYNER